MKIDVGGITLNYTERGNGKPVILLHGNGEDHHIFDKLADALVSRYTVYAVDSRNHGGSSMTGDYSYESMAGDIRGFIEKMGLRGAAAVGFSDGAIVALTLAIRDPGLFGRMVLLGVNLKPSDFRDENLAWLSDEYERTGDPLLKLMLEQPDIEPEQLRSVTTPTLVVGAGDDLFRPGLFESVAAAIPGAELLIMEGHEHDSYVTGQDILYPHLKDFLG